MGDLFGAKKAAKIQAKAIKESARAQALQAGYQAESAAQQQSLAGQQRSAQQSAEELLSTPMESATVDLATDEGDASSEDLITRRRTTRQRYQTAPKRSGVQTP